MTPRAPRGMIVEGKMALITRNLQETLEAPAIQVRARRSTARARSRGAGALLGSDGNPAMRKSCIAHAQYSDSHLKLIRKS